MFQTLLKSQYVDAGSMVKPEQEYKEDIMKKQVFIITIMVVAALATACGQRASGRKNTMSTSKQKAVASPTKKEQKAVASPTKKEQEATASPTKKEQERASAVAKESLDEEDIHAALKVAKEYYKHTTQKVKSLEYNGGSGDQIQFQGKDTKSGKYRIIRLKKKNGKWVVKGEGY
ncbi:hypothetical protein DW981_06905 [Clostridium sp. AM49-4BH]|nr:hypothetical protein DW981_06905 [Clostridium sp. AM49-4BH]